jgi:hypothetical protein
VTRRALGRCAGHDAPMFHVVTFAVSLAVAPQADAPQSPTPTPSATALPRFAAPIRIEADGKPIVTVVGHAAPFLVDLDDDGKRDLVVGMFGNDTDAKGGAGRFYKNVGTDAAPRFATSEPFTVDGQLATMESS